MVQLLWKSLAVPKKLNIGLLHNLAILLLCIYPKDMTAGIHIKPKQIFIVALIMILHSSKQKQPKCPSTNELINEMWYIHTMSQITGPTTSLTSSPMIPAAKDSL